LSVKFKNSITSLCFIRHGQSTWNAEKRVQGQLDPPLSPLGRAQAELVAQRLKNGCWSALYSSDLCRAKKTAEAIAKHNNRSNLKIHIDPMLRERSLGKAEGLLIDELRERYPDFLNANMPEPNFETIEELEERSIKVYTGIRDAHLGERVIIVTHGGLIRAFLKNIFPHIEQFLIRNTSCTLLHWNGEEWTYEYLGDVSHLDGTNKTDKTLCNTIKTKD